MNVLILGYGAVGTVLAKLLHKEKVITKVICADILFKKEKKFEKMHHMKINLKNKKQLTSIIKKHNPHLIINASSPNFNTDILSVCEKTATPYMDMAACWEPDSNKKAKCPYKIEQLDFNKSFRKNNLLGLIEAGVSPGMTNLFVRECADEFDFIEDVKIRLIDYSGTNELHFAWSKEALLDEINSKPLIYRNGKFKIVEPFSGEEEYNFPKPYGKKKVSLICQDEIGTIPFFIKLKNIDIKDYDNHVELHKFIYKLGIISREKIKVGNVEISPFDFAKKVLPDAPFSNKDKKFSSAQFAFAVEATGRIKKKKRTIRYFVSFPKQQEINRLKLKANFITYPTALSAKIFVLAMQRIKTMGIMPPEALDKDVRKFILSELKKTGHVVIKKEKW